MHTFFFHQISDPVPKMNGLFLILTNSVSAHFLLILIFPDFSEETTQREREREKDRERRGGRGGGGGQEWLGGRVKVIAQILGHTFIDFMHSGLFIKTEIWPKFGENL